jgi:hypothetical protein
MTRKEILDKVGFFDPDFFLYYEETELERRIKAAEYKIYSIPSAEIIHLEGTSFSLNEERERHIFHGRENFFNKIYSKSYKKLADGLNILFLTLAIFTFSLTGKREEKKKYQFRKSLYLKKNKR